ncbi:MAG TPA: c-type cytochrome [Longimicrobiaceae bacterium]|nr:c-type cytochrome [Longimicrobiaceae bacterium]
MSARACAALLLAVALAAGCRREERQFRSYPPAAEPEGVEREGELAPGPRQPEVTARNPYEHNAYAVSEGKRLYGWYNCVGCHAHGGGGMGPPLMDDEWIYGSEPENVFRTIAHGRPNGMPAFGGRIGNDEIWKLTAYVRSMSALEVPQDVRGGRDDHMQVKQPEQEENPAKPRSSTTPPASTQP